MWILGLHNSISDVLVWEWWKAWCVHSESKDNKGSKNNIEFPYVSCGVLHMLTQT